MKRFAEVKPGDLIKFIQIVGGPVGVRLAIVLDVRHSNDPHKDLTTLKLLKSDGNLAVMSTTQIFKLDVL